jgi:tRNA A-37 threonylcarbamoyl transferase component Bud32
MGAVYVAEQQSTGKPRALKLMHADLLKDAGQRARFEQEARVGALLASDHVVQVIAAGVDEATRMPWMAMELLEGEDLAACVRRRGALAPAETFEILRQACHALAAAHAAGVVHRDVKPENVFLARTRGVDAAVTVKVLDFGIAKILAAMQTAATTNIGTPLWMAPEQTEVGADVLPATDVWAIGLLAFWMLTGRWYWLAANESSPSMPVLLREIVMQPIVKASARARELGVAERIPPLFDTWFERCVVRDPSARYRNAGEAIAALGAVLMGSAAAQAVTGPPPSTATRRSRVPLVASLLVGLGVVVGAVALLAWRLAPDQPGPVTPGAHASASPSDAPQPSTPAATGSVPVGRTTIPAGHPSAKPAASARAFDRVAAEAAVEGAAKRAALFCKGRKGPSSVRVDVIFTATGIVRRATSDPQVAATEAGICVDAALMSAKAPPFDGHDETVSTTVGL